MSGGISLFVAWLLKASAVLFLFNEVRGLLLAAPVLYGMYQAGGSLMAIWIGICSLGGIALSVIVPLVAAVRLKRIHPDWLPHNYHNERSWLRLALPGACQRRRATSR